MQKDFYIQEKNLLAAVKRQPKVRVAFLLRFVCAVSARFFVWPLRVD